ncbi:MAG: flagellar biosynthesis protein [Oscillospiraceae bacterium]|nr:flagellar biosynthesis protein [Oscillospiraceae bacterium]MBR2928052.1 flagellar biosynthesis protein [Oscillospiraceae bacterium]MBR6678208.1 flagellar biosynthesis protein [Oscillospiraceae bacterium]
MIERLHNQGLVQQQTAATSSVSGKAPAGGFGQLLQERLNQQTTPDVTFSKHAKTRAEERGIEITQSLIDQLKGGMIRAQAKGATNVIAMDSEKAFIINVPNAKVITAITQDEMGESVFTNIDGAVFL